MLNDPIQPLRRSILVQIAEDTKLLHELREQLAEDPQPEESAA